MLASHETNNYEIDGKTYDPGKTMKEKPTYEELEQRVRELENERIQWQQAEASFQEAEESEARYRGIFDHTNNGVAVYKVVNDGQDFIFTDFNRACEKIEGIGKDEVLGKSVRQIFPGVKEFGLFDVLKRVWKTGKPENFPVSQYKDDRISGWRENHVYKLPSGEIVAVYSDETERMQAEQDLKKAKDELEFKIQERTAELSVANLQLTEEISERNKIEIELHDSIIQWRSTFDAVTSAISLLDLDGTILKCNTAMTEFIGKSFSEVIGATCWEIVHNTSKPIQGCPFVKMKKTFRRETLALSLEDKWMEVTVDPVLDENGVLKGAVHIITDITDRKRAESALKISEERYRNLFDKTGTATLVIEEDMTISQINTKCEELSGYSRQEIVGKMKTTDFVPPEDLERAIDYHLKRRGEVEAAPPEYEVNLVDKFGNVKTLFIQIGLIPGTKQSIASLIDITPRKQAEQALRESEDKFNRAFMFSPDLISIYRMKDGKYIDVNDNFLKISGYRRDEVIEKTAERLRIWGDPDDRELLIKKLEDTGGVNNYETNFRIKDGSLIPCLLSARLIEIKGEKCIISITRDIRERKREEEKRRKLEGHLQQSRKLEAVSVLAGGIAHEFNNALAVVAGNIELLQMDLPDHENVINFGQAAKTSVNRMANLTDQLLAYARGGKYRPENINLSDFVKDTLTLMKHDVDPKISIETELPSNIVKVNGDLTQLQTVLSTIVTNAIEALEGEGRLQIKTGDEFVGEEVAETYPGLKSGKYTCLTIKDDGKGMDDETKSRVFEPFFTTKIHGRGLGMAAVYGIVKNHNGYIYVDSEPGKGTAVRIFLPPVEVFEEEAEIAEPELTLGTGTILVIEDEEMLLEVIRAMLEKLGYRVLCAKTGKEAIGIANSFDGDIDLALLDIKLPDMEGSRIYPIIKEYRPKMKVIVCSGYALDGPAQEILNAGAQGFIKKPFVFKEIFIKIRSVLEGNYIIL
jgi:two-component system cell cycle sensor histidine kinase/response regulator CckA